MTIETTGRYLVLLPEEDLGSGIQALSSATGISGVARAADFEDHAFTTAELESPNASVFDRLGVAVVPLDPDQAQSVRASAAAHNNVLAIQPERIVYAIGQAGLSADYLRGYSDAATHLCEQAGAQKGQLNIHDQPVDYPEFKDDQTTWGLKATRVIESTYSGLGIKIAVLDTGLDLAHPDFAGRVVHSRSFIAGESAQDANGHGTHCIGTACGPKDSPELPRYGIAYNAEIFAGKVLSDRGSGSDSGILAGIEWAVNNGCAVISMSLGAPTRPGDTYSPIYERVGQRALRSGSLIIAAAGNDSTDLATGRRLAPPKPVGYPANAPSLMAVAALNNQLQVASFSNGTINLDGGQLDIAGPGVDVHSTWPMPDRYNNISGTSMATPHVSGIAALYAEATGARGMELWAWLMRDAQRLGLSGTDVGIGLVQAPLL
ncbi:S8 family peptidase [Leptothoe spongobia]|uniref:S8 family serine peptidase n=1 Tax=Leptothoe spongobia TAU-MAC 1115 TaxID=1967444 RepID=A0A947DJD1_9CYAN|nr:S8 family serine peptidase [Leptothoe spongobia]MBT9318002.1 S8 family serine peptidase [Leptothoe spongobia TAU-MAC 1115]